MEELNTAHPLRFGSHLLIYDEHGGEVVRPVPTGPEYIYISLVEQGSASFYIDGIAYEVKAGDLLVIIHAKMTVREQRSVDYHARVALLSRQYVDYLNVPKAYRMFLALRRCPLLHLDAESWQQMANCFRLISSTLRQEDNQYRNYTIYYAVKTYLFTLAFLSHNEGGTLFRREEDIAMRFFDLLEENYRTEHSVSFYADQLHMTPKYLSASVKSATGKTALDAISERLLLQSQKMLLQSDQTISEVCYQLGFLTPSAFGKFFRSHTGIGPREWRNAHQ